MTWQWVIFGSVVVICLTAIIVDKVSYIDGRLIIR